MEKVELIRTQDGQLHDTEEYAKAHIAEKLAEIFDIKCNKILVDNPHWKRQHVIDVVRFLFDDYDEAKELILNLYRVVE